MFKDDAAAAVKSVSSGPLSLDLNRSGKVMINFTATIDAIAGAPADALFRYTILVDGVAIPPTVDGVVSAPVATGSAVATTTMVTLTAGSHRIDVVAQASDGASYRARNQALTAHGPLD